MNHKNVVFALLAGFLVLGATEPSSMKPVSRAHLCVTEGQIEELSGGKMSVTVPKMRAFVTDPTLQEVEAHFTYRGPTDKSAPLASGKLRRQFGLKLRAQDGCNLIYAMWRIEPEQEIVVSVKSNPGMTRSSECDAHGYRNVKPVATGSLPHIVVGKQYTLRAIIRRGKMVVYADNKPVWQGNLGPAALNFNGPVGVRTDNGQFQFELFAGIPAAGQKGASAECHAGSGDE